MRYGKSYLKKIIGTQNQLVELSSLVAKTPFNNSSKNGFHVKFTNQDILFAFYISSFVTNRTRFDPETNTFIAERVEEYKTIPFAIDSKNNVLEIYSNKTSCAELITQLGMLSRFSLSISDIEFDIPKIIANLEEKKVTYIVKSLRISELELVPGSLASCSIKVTDKSIVSYIVNNYQATIDSIQMVIERYDNKIPISINKGGVFRIGLDMDDDYDIYDGIRTLLLEVL